MDEILDGRRGVEFSARDLANFVGVFDHARFMTVLIACSTAAGAAEYLLAIFG